MERYAARIIFAIRINHAGNEAIVGTRVPPPARTTGNHFPQNLYWADEGRALEPAQGPKRRVCRLSKLRSRRRFALPGLESLWAARQALYPALSGRRRPALLH